MSNQVRPATAGGGVPGGDGLGGMVGASASAEPTAFVSQVPGTPVSFPSYHGRPVSWVAVSLMLLGFLVGGLGLVFGPTWWAFWVGIGIVAVGGLLALATGISNDWY
jgi:hypothetical protein